MTLKKRIILSLIWYCQKAIFDKIYEFVFWHFHFSSFFILQLNYYLQILPFTIYYISPWPFYLQLNIMILYYYIYTNMIVCYTIHTYTSNDAIKRKKDNPNGLLQFITNQILDRFSFAHFYKVQLQFIISNYEDISHNCNMDDDIK